MANPQEKLAESLEALEALQKRGVVAVRSIIPVEHRDEYMAALEAGSVGRDIRPFAVFLGDLVRRTLSR